MARSPYTSPFRSDLCTWPTTCRDGDQPNYYNPVLTTTTHQREIAATLETLGLPPDSRRYRYRPLHQQPIFAPYTSLCPNAEALATSTFQLPAHPNLPDATVEWIAARLAIIAREGTTP